MAPMASFARLACRCLNCVAQVGPLLETPPPPSPPQLAPSQKLAFSDKVNVSCEHPSLLEGKEVGRWTVYRCMLCNTFTHASSVENPSQMLLNSIQMTDDVTISKLKNSKNFSQTFKVLMKYEEENTEESPPSSTALGHLKKVLSDVLQVKMEKTEEEIRIFTDKKYSEFKDYKEQAYHDFQLLTSAFSPLTSNIKNIRESENTTLEYLSPIAKKQPSLITSAIEKPKSNVVKTLADIGCYKEDSLDSEGIFDLEGMDSSVSPHYDHNSDAYESDIDDSVSRDEGIQVTLGSDQAWKSPIAKSLPVNVPVFAQHHEDFSEKIDQNVEHDIAASIQALARSVHGDVYELPRPRFSTQF